MKIPGIKISRLENPESRRFAKNPRDFQNIPKKSPGYPEKKSRSPGFLDFRDFLVSISIPGISGFCTRDFFEIF